MYIRRSSPTQPPINYVIFYSVCWYIYVSVMNTHAYLFYGGRVYELGFFHFLCDDDSY